MLCLDCMRWIVRMFHSYVSVWGLRVWWSMFHSFVLGGVVGRVCVCVSVSGVT